MKNNEKSHEIVIEKKLKIDSKQLSGFGITIAKYLQFVTKLLEILINDIKHKLLDEHTIKCFICESKSKKTKKTKIK